MSSDRIKDLILELALLGVGIFALLYIVNQASGHEHLRAVNFTTFPIMISAGIILLSGIKLSQTVRQLLIDGHRKSESGPRVSLFKLVQSIVYALRKNLALVTRFIGTVVLTSIYAVVLGSVNFFVLTAIFLLVMFWLYGLRSIRWTIIIALIAAGGLYGIFVSFLHLPIS